MTMILQPATDSVAAMVIVGLEYKGLQELV